MKRLSENIKQMMNTLALQDAADFLPGGRTRLMQQAGGHLPASSDLPRECTPAPVRRVALLSDGININEVLLYALEACQRQQATLDLVLYGKAKEQVPLFRGQLQARGIAHELILLGTESVDALSEYLSLRRTLIYLIAPADDPLALELTEQVLPSRGGRLHLPVVLVDRNRHSQIHPIHATRGI
jgi:hypothetical protein